MNNTTDTSKMLKLKINNLFNSLDYWQKLNLKMNLIRISDTTTKSLPIVEIKSMALDENDEETLMKLESLIFTVN